MAIQVQSLSVPLGLRSNTLGSNATLAIAFPLIEGDVSVDSHSDANRIGLYAKRDIGSESLVTTVLGIDSFTVTSTGVNTPSIAIGTTDHTYRVNIEGVTGVTPYPIVRIKNTGTNGKAYWLSVGGNADAGSFWIYDENAGEYRIGIASTGDFRILGTTPNTADAGEVRIGNGLIRTSGNIYIKNVAYTWPDANLLGVLSNDGTGVLTWETVVVDSFYTNTDPTPTTIGGITAGSTFNSVSMSDMWTSLLYPYQVPAFTAFSIGQSSPIEVGTIVGASLNCTWSTSNSSNVQVNSLVITDVTRAITLASGLANDGSETVAQTPVSYSTSASNTWRIVLTDTHLNTHNSSVTVSWRWRAFWGLNSNSTLTEAQIKALASNALTTGIAGTYSMGATGYKFICISAALGGQVNTVKDQSTNLSIPMATIADDAAYSNVDGGGYSYALVSVTNGNSVTNDYRVYRTKNAFGSSIVLVVT